MEHGARIEIRELAGHPQPRHRVSRQLITADRPLWRADLFDRLGSDPGRFDAAHYHPRFHRRRTLREGLGSRADCRALGLAGRSDRQPRRRAQPGRLVPGPDDAAELSGLPAGS